MEIRNINSNIDILQSLTRNSEALNFKKGDVVVAEIVAINGETIALKTSDELLLTGKLLAELEFKLGQQMEFEVAGKQGSKFILQTMSSNMDSVEISANTQEQTVESRESVIVSNLLNNLGIAATEDNINTVLIAMKENPSLDIKATIFMLTNDIAFTEENIQSVTTLETNNGSISQNLSNILNQMVIDKAFPESYEAKAHLQNIIQTNTGDQQSIVTTPLSAEQHQTSIIKPTISVNDGYYSVTAEIITQEVATPNNSEAVQQVLSSDNQGVVIENSTLPSESIHVKALLDSLLGNNTAVENADVIIGDQQNETNGAQNQLPGSENIDFSASLAAISDDRSLQILLPKIISLFTRIDDIKEGKTNVKQINEENIEKLIELKEAIKNSDIKNRDILAAKTEELISQNKVSSEVKRFAFYNIPINFHNGQQTAEIYVYKRRSKKKVKNSSELSILVGLDTQNLGRFEVLVKAESKNLSIKMSRESERANEVIELRTRKLKKAFSDMGFNLSSFKIEKLSEKTTVTNAEQVLSSGTGSLSRIDYTV